MKIITLSTSIALASVTMLQGCGSTLPDATSSRPTSNVTTTESAGVTSATISASATGDQRMVASATANVPDAGATFPPGSIAVETSVALGQASDKGTAIVGESGTATTVIAQKTVPVYIGPATGAIPVLPAPMTVSLPFVLSSSALALNATTSKLVFLYAVYTSAGWVSGVKPLTATDFVGTFFTTKVKGFGYFQIAYVNEALPEKEVVSAVQPTLK